MNHQPPDYECKFGHSEIIPNSLYLGGEDDVDQLLYGEEEARHLNGKGAFKHDPVPLIDTWIDLRDNRPTNRKVYVPDLVEYISIPFRDGFIEEAREHLPKAKEVLTKRLKDNKRVLVTCHQGMSRSVMLVLWHLMEEKNSYLGAYLTIQSARPIMSPDKNFKPLLEEWKEQYPLYNW